jgi:hypothetical protein
MLSRHQIGTYREILGKVLRNRNSKKILFNFICHPLKSLKFISSPLFDAKLKGESKRAESERLTRTINQLTSFFPFEVTSLLNHDNELQKHFVHSNSKRSKILGDIFQKLGSDKKFHGYQGVYQAVIDDVLSRTSRVKLLEIGIGTNYLDVKSNMGINGIPGASLRSFRDFIPHSNIYGADIDSRILFEEDRIKTFHVDQMSEQSLNSLMLEVGNCDVLIDDGLHTSEANLLTLKTFIPFVAMNGWIIIEDIDGFQENLLIWNMVSVALKKNFSCYLVACDNSYLFLAKRVS